MYSKRREKKGRGYAGVWTFKQAKEKKEGNRCYVTRTEF